MKKNFAFTAKKTRKGFSFEEGKTQRGFFFGEKKTQSGFTLIEILVVIGIFGVVAALAVGMFLSLLKGAAKARVLAEVKQNGDYSLRVMERMFRNAQEIVHPTGSPDSYGISEIMILNPDNVQTTFSCSDLGNGNAIASNSASLISDQVQVEDCTGFFTVNKGQHGLTPDEVVINFTLRKTGSGGHPEEEASINFNSRVVLRNIVRE